VISTGYEGRVYRHPQRSLGSMNVWRPEYPRSPKGGRPWNDDRRVMAGIVYCLKTGCQWDAIPEEFGSGSTCYPRVGGGRGVPHAARGDGPVLRRERWRLPELVFDGQRDNQGTKKADLTGPNPTGRAKSSSKRHILTDRREVFRCRSSSPARTCTTSGWSGRRSTTRCFEAAVARGARGTCAWTRATTKPTPKKMSDGAASSRTSVGAGSGEWSAAFAARCGTGLLSVQTPGNAVASSSAGSAVPPITSASFKSPPPATPSVRAPRSSRNQQGVGPVSHEVTERCSAVEKGWSTPPTCQLTTDLLGRRRRVKECS
jgi:hypothetical protein